MLLKVLLFLIAFLVGADELMLGPLLAPISAELGVAPERVTLFITAYSVALALIAPLLGDLSDRRGRLRVMLPASLLFGAASVATGLVASFEVGLATRVITGLASAGMLPIAFAMAADGAPADAMKRIAWVQSGLTLGMISSPAVGALLAQLSSWRTPFIVLGLCAWAVAGALAWLTVRTQQVHASGTHPAPQGSVLAIPGALGALLAMGLGLGGGIGSPALQGYIAQLAPAQRGMLMSLAMTLMHLGVALWSAVAGFAYSAGPMAMALLALLLFGGAILALRPHRAQE